MERAYEGSQGKHSTRGRCAFKRWPVSELDCRKASMCSSVVPHSLSLYYTIFKMSVKHFVILGVKTLPYK